MLYFVICLYCLLGLLRFFALGGLLAHVQLPPGWVFVVQLGTWLVTCSLWAHHENYGGRAFICVLCFASLNCVLCCQRTGPHKYSGRKLLTCVLCFGWFDSIRRFAVHSLGLPVAAIHCYTWLQALYLLASWPAWFVLMHWFARFNRFSLLWFASVANLFSRESRLIRFLTALFCLLL